MDFRFTPEEEKFRKEVVDFIEQELTPEVRPYSDGPNRWIGASPPGGAFEPYKAFQRKLGAKGWISMTWPKQYGGQGRSIIYDYILDETLRWYGAPIMGMAAHVVAPTLLSVGTEDQKKKYLPIIAKGDVEFCLGYSEDNAGTDLANIQVRATADGDFYVIKGQKIFTTEAHTSEYVWLMARTDPGSKRHKGLSLFMVPINLPGISISPMWTMAGGRTNIVYFDNVQVHKTEMVGEPHKGWYNMAVALDLERLRIYSWASYLPTLLEFIDYCKTTKRGKKSLFDDPLVRQKLSDLYMGFQIGRLLTYRTAWILARGVVPNYEASMIKVFHSELSQKLAQAVIEIAGHKGLLREGSVAAEPKFKRNLDVEHFYRVCPQPIFAGGTAAVMRSIIAVRGMGLPRAF